MNMLFKNSCRGKDLGLLLLRVGIGLIFFLVHGYPKLMAGSTKWIWLGNQMALFGITFAPTAWGFLAAAIECVGGGLLIIGFATRFVSFLLASVMFVASYMHLYQGDGFSGAAHALSLLTVFVSLMFSGAGAYSVDEKLKS